MSEPAEGSSQPDLLSRIKATGPVRPPLKPAVNQPSRKQAPRSSPTHRTEWRDSCFLELDKKIARNDRIAEERKESRAKASKKPHETERYVEKAFEALDRIACEQPPEVPGRPNWDVRSAIWTWTLKV